MRALKTAARSSVVWLFLAASAQGQVCTPEWSREFMEQGLNDTVAAAVVFDLDGAGPAGETLVVGGAFSGAGGTPLAHIASWTGTGWAQVGAGLPGAVANLAVVDEDGPGPLPEALYACCSLTPQNVFRWNGSVWLPLGGNFNHHATDMVAFDEDGAGPLPTRLFIAGRFTWIGNGPVTGIARWNGADWTAVGGGTDEPAEALAVFDEDGAGPNPPRLFAGGEFTEAGGVPASLIARWDGQTWSPVGSGLTGGNQRVHCFEVWDADGAGPQGAALYVGGHYDIAGGSPARGVSRWDGQAWSAVGTGLPGNVFDLHPVDDDGTGPNPESLVAVGLINHLSPPHSPHVSRFNGTDWVAMGTGANAGAEALATFDFDGAGPQAPRLVMTGDFTDCAYTAGTPINATRIAAWDGGTWVKVGPTASNGMDDFVSVLAAHDEDEGGPLPAKLFAGGRFRTAGGIPGRIVRRDGSAWTPVGTTTGGDVFAMATHDEDGPGGAPARLFAGGSFGTMGGVSARVARWDGSAWTAAGAGVNLVYTHALRSWDADGAGPEPSRLIAAGDRFTSPTHVRAWDGAVWSNVGANFNRAVRALEAFDADGPGPGPERLVAGGEYTQIGASSVKSVAEWNGTAWVQLGTGVSNSVASLAVFDEDGVGANPPRLFAGGRFTQAGTLTVNSIARWNGVSWSALPSGQPFAVGLGSDVDALTVMDEDGPGPAAPALFAAGSFHEDFNTPSGLIVLENVARWSGAAWSALGSGTSWDARALAALDPDGAGPAAPSLYVGGRLTTAGGISSARIARWGCPSCYPDCDGDSVLSLADFGCFQTKFALGDPYADCDGDAALTLADFGCFQTKFALGCP